MTKYYVSVPELHWNIVEIEAESPDEAKARVLGGEGESIRTDYAYTLDGIGLEVEVETVKEDA